tara:strand:+ start:1312 stop:3057 length:1746 start_codon:yes stop_codon:yes gene_type:complete
MKKIIFFSLLIFIFSCNSNKKNRSNFTTHFEDSNGKETSKYKDVISYYTNLADSYSEISIFSFGQTDSGEPLHLVVYNSEGVYNVDEIKKNTKNRILINNGIHPGESDGIDASMLFLRDIVQNDSLKDIYKNTLITIIPVYNVGGALNRNSYSRANQNGPKDYGFRGNTRNFDLNRDFIKQDTKNSVAFTEIFHTVNPDIFIDNHVSNGADYQYAITHLFTQHNKLGGELGLFLESKIRPLLEESLEEKGIAITPYVNVWGTTPDKGWSQFYDSPRYSTGYTTLFNTFGMMVETHMLKPYKIRVEQTYELLFSMMDILENNSSNIKKIRNNAVANIISKNTYPLSFKIDRQKPTILNFKGYEASIIDSKVTNGKRILYDNKKPFTKEVNYFNNSLPNNEIRIPKAYILKKGWHKVIDRLESNKIEFTKFDIDTTIIADVQHIANYKTRVNAYEGHYLHYDVKILAENKMMSFSKGDIYIPTNQNGIRYIIETLEAEGVDSFFCWNFFDTILQRKEGFSGYVFEDFAEVFLKENPIIKKELLNKIDTDESFSRNQKAQLDFVYKKTQHYEKAHLLLPIFKVY